MSIPRLARLDIPDRFAGRMPVAATQLLTAGTCCAGAIGLRLLVDQAAPGAAAFAPMYPAVLLATLFARWEAGALTLALLTLYVWHEVLPPVGSFALEKHGEVWRAGLNAASGLTVLAFAETFRRAVRRAVAQRDDQIVERDLFLRELDHRVKNNFAIVSSLLEMQRRRAADEPTRAALGVALGRVQSIAHVHTHLYRDVRQAGLLDMQAYLGELCATLADALFLSGSVTLHCACEAAMLPRDRAVSIGLVLNELVTNAAKHAFTGRERGTITVAFGSDDAGWRLTVADDGCGLPETARDGSLGHRLIDAFSHQAGGVLTTASTSAGARFDLVLHP